MTYPNQPGAGTPGGPPYRTPDAPPQPPDKPNPSRFILPVVIVLMALAAGTCGVQDIRHPEPGATALGSAIGPLFVVVVCIIALIFWARKGRGNLT
jgi:hypothetical protein